MVQSILSDNISVKPDNTSEQEKTTSICDFANVLEKTNTPSNENTATSATAEEMSLQDKFQSMISGITVCAKCSSIYIGQAVETCSKCGNDLEEQRQNAQKNIKNHSVNK
ncbi:MAG: hypothetical protein PHV68_05510 [Candidatus Gastranaerophilales bacterium]|nr:hypothetical protein [Candidatus Gastranaerophilales bacterium]